MNMHEIATTALIDKKARDVRVLDISQLTTIASQFVIASGTSSTHIKSLADAVEEQMKDAGFAVFGRHGYNSARWILLDFGEIVIHIFHEEDRAFYNLERLWQDAELVFIHDV